MDWVPSVQPKCSVPFQKLVNFRNFKPEFLLNGKSPGMDFIRTVPRPYLLGRPLIWSGHSDARSVGHFWSISVISVEFVGKVLWIRFSSWKGFIGFHIWGCPISTSLSVFFFYRWIRIQWRKLCWNGSDGDWDVISCLLPCVLYCMGDEFEQIITKLRWALRTTTINCRVSFIDFYLVYPTNFRIVF